MASTLDPDWICRSLLSGILVSVDADVSTMTQVTNTVSATLSSATNLQHVTGLFLSIHCSQWSKLLGICKLDQCNLVLVGTSQQLQDRLQPVLNGAAWLIYSHRMSEHMAPLLGNCTGYAWWSKSSSGSVFWHITTAWHSTAPAFLTDSLQLPSQTVSHCYLCWRHHDATCATSSQTALPWSRFLWLQHRYGTVCYHRPLCHNHHLTDRNLARFLMTNSIVSWTTLAI